MAGISDVNLKNKNKAELSFELDVDTVHASFNMSGDKLSGEGDNEVWSDDIEEYFEFNMDQARELRELLNMIIE